MSDLDGILDVIEHEEGVAVPPKESKEESKPAKSEEDKGEDNTEKPTEEPKEESAKPDTSGEATKTDESAESPSEETPEPSKPVPEDSPEFDWKATLPPAPAEYQGKVPEIDDATGLVSNMTPQEYTQYMIDMATMQMRKEAYNQTIEGRALDVAERILPEIKTNKGIALLVQNARIASILSGNAIDTVQAARQVKEALGLGTERLSEAKAEGARNAKASITVQKNAALETNGSSKAKPDKTIAEKLDKRLRAGDDEAFVELFGILDKQGKL